EVADQAADVGPVLDGPARLERALAEAHDVDLATRLLGHGANGVDDVLGGDLDVGPGPVGQVDEADVVAHGRQHLAVVPTPVRLRGEGGAVDEQHRVVGTPERGRAGERLGEDIG